MKNNTDLTRAKKSWRRNIGRTMDIKFSGKIIHKSVVCTGIDIMKETIFFYDPKTERDHTLIWQKGISFEAF